MATETYLRRSAFDEEYYDKSGKEIPVSITPELIRELKSCLNYSSLLPIGTKLKGINKICMGVRANDNEKRLHKIYLTYPEAMGIGALIVSEGK